MLELQPEREAALGFVRDYRDRVLAAAAARAAEMAPGLLIGTDPVEGQAARAVTKSGSDALMLVVGFRGIGAFAAMVLGSVAALAFAFEEAALRKASLLAVHAWQAPQDGTVWAEGGSRPLACTSPRGGHRQALQSLWPARSWLRPARRAAPRPRRHRDRPVVLTAGTRRHAPTDGVLLAAAPDGCLLNSRSEA